MTPRTVPADSNPGAPPFDRRFFATAFHERVKTLCQKQGKDVAVVLLQLGDGCVLDLCHIEALTPKWMAVAVFRDSASCEEMDTVLVPYDAIARVILSKREISERHIGFQLEKPVPALTRPEGESAA